MKWIVRCGRDGEALARGACRARKISLRRLRFSLDSCARENYTFVSCFMHVNAASMFDIDWERRQTQPRQSIKAKATHSGNAQSAFPEVFNRLYSCGFCGLRKEPCVRQLEVVC
jgi:hypothetical protein